MIKTTGKEWLRFLQDPKFWPGETYMDDTTIKINGDPDHDYDDTKIKPEDVIVVEDGVMFINGDTDKCRSLTGTFRQWKKSQNMDTLLVEIPRDKLDEFKALVKTIKGKILT